MAKLVAWLIVSHHRLPNLKTEAEYKKYSVENVSCINDLFEFIEADWGYQNKFDEKEYQQRLKLCFEFEQGLLTQSCLLYTAGMRHQKANKCEIKPTPTQPSNAA